jgi:hypothetical protein
MRDVTVVGVFGIVDVKRDDLVVGSLIGAHRDDPDVRARRIASSTTASLAEDDGVESITVGAARPWEESVVRGVDIQDESFA